MHKRNIIACCCAFTAALAFATLGYAAEAFKPVGPIGGTDIRQAFLPPPGLYGAAVGVGLDLPRYYTRDDSLRSHGNPRIGGIGLLYVYDTELWGGKLGTTLYGSYEKTSFAVEPAPKGRSTGFNDPYSDVLMWSRFFPSDEYASQPNDGVRFPYGLQVLAGLGVSFPLGRYGSNRHVNDGSNIFDIAPNVALTYTTPSPFWADSHSAIELSMRTFFNNYTKNPATHYKNGFTPSLDFAVTQRLQSFQFGLSGTGYKQLTDDTIQGDSVPNGGNRSSFLALGPLAAYDFSIYDHPSNLMVKMYFAAAGANTAKSNGIVIRLISKLF